MTRPIKDIERDIRSLTSEERVALLRSLIAELDSPADLNVEREWLAAAQYRYQELVEGKVQGVAGPLVFQRLRAMLGE